MLKHRLGSAEVFGFAQPPSGGCVLKQLIAQCLNHLQ
nr:MAG TPA: hypothetical protein [Herelleviridae sp.]